MRLSTQMSIRWKLVLAIIGAAGSALLLALAGFLWLEFREYRGSAKREITVPAEVLAGKALGAVDFKDPRDGERLLATLHVQRRILDATLFDRDGQVFASYRREGAITLPLPTVLPREGTGFEENHLWLVHQVRSSGQTLGTLYLRSDLTELNANLRWGIVFGCLLTGLIGAIAFFVAYQVGKLVSEPILHLAETARRVADSRKLEERVVRESNDEVGLLVDAFNTMLDRLGERQARLEETQRHVHLGSWAWDLEAESIEWSDEIFRILDLEPGGDPPGKGDLRPFLHPDDRSAVVRRMDNTRNGKGDCGLDCRVVRPGGEVRWVHLMGSLHPTQSSQGVVQGTMMDISERRRTEDAMHQAQKLESLGVLTGGIAHDFNNLLSALIGYLEISRMELPEDAHVQGYLAKAQAITTKATHFTRQMLAYSGHGRFEVKPLLLNQLVQEMGHLLSISISKMTHLRYHLKEPLPAILADTSQLQQVVMNLVINGSEALEGREGRVTLRTAMEYLEEDDLGVIFAGQDMTPGEYVVLEVEDNGHGMSPETLARIFDPFFTTKFQGRGLGLAAMLGIVKGHHGGIKVYSEVGKGTRFKLFFPTSFESPQAADTESSYQVYMSSGLVLVVDDEEDVRTTLSLKLKRMGFEVLQAEDGREGLRCFEEHRGQLRLVVTDLTMPHMDGAESFLAMRALDPTIPVLMVSGFTEPEAVDHLLQMGLAGVMPKPIRFTPFAEKIRDILEKENA